MFLTELDSRAGIKRSRDPLGLVPLWGYFGRKVVGNLTTVTNSVRGFTTTLFGYYFAREVQEREARSTQSTLELFLKFEQLAGYSRYRCANDGEFRGITYVKRNLAKGNTVRLSARTEDQILSNQKIYSLWGLYSVPARASGLLQQGQNELTASARAFVESQYIAILDREGLKGGREIVDLLRVPRPEVQLAGKHERIARAIAHLLRPKYSVAERDFYRSHLVLGGSEDSTAGLQSRAAELMSELPRREQFNRPELRHLIKQATSRRDGWEALALALQRIDHLESVLIPAASAFGYLLARNGRNLGEVTADLAKHWGSLRHIDVEACRALRPELEAASSEASAAERWVKMAEALAAGEYKAVLKLLLEHNAAVMQGRNGSAPWVRLVAGRLDVRFRDEAIQLPGRQDLPDAWVNNYFLNPLKDVIGTLGSA
jgi:hypothetical protein